MALSDSEKQMFAQLEASLRENDPDFYRNMQNTGGEKAYSTRNIVIGSLIVIAGIGIVLFGVTINLLILGVLGFIVMGAGGYIATKTVSTAYTGPKDDFNKSQHSAFMANLERKWDERRQREENEGQR